MGTILTSKSPPFTVGIEEEYLLVDRETRDVCVEPPDEMLERCEARAPGQITPEFLRAQIEVGTKVCNTISEARADLARLRRCIVKTADEYGIAPIAASTHPFASWHRQKRTEKERYRDLNRDMQASARRLLICGMHVHVGLNDDDLRIDLMNQFSYFLPHLLALSCSSPYWCGDDTGLNSYRLTVFDGMPRTRLPERFTSFGEYQRHVDTLIESGLIQDSSKIWWDVRPSARYPTLEMRVTDICTRVDDAAAIAALSVCLLSALYRYRRQNMRWRQYLPMLVQENRWRAMRYGPDEGLVDFGRKEIVPYRELLDEILEMVAEDAERLNCTDEVRSTRDILRRGNSARQQRECYARARADGRDHDEALRDVVDLLIENTRLDL
ncbi:MAG: carboxylate-amine ligase [Gammaproteobacteria bacterium]